MIITIYDRLNIARSEDFKTEGTQGIARHYGSAKKADEQDKRGLPEYPMPFEN